MPMRTLDAWLTWAPILDRIYQEELGRSAFSDPEAFVNWTFHWREYGSTEAEIRAAIQESPEWWQRHGGGQPDLPPPPPPPLTGQSHVILVAPGPFYQRQMSYWANAHRDGDTVYMFAGDPSRGGPAFFVVDLPSSSVRPWDPHVPYGGETEGWEWRPDGRLQIFEGPRVHAIDPHTGHDEILVDISDIYPGHTLWQPHISQSGRTITATVKDPNYQKIATVAYRDGTLILNEPKEGTLDESAPCGDDWVIIKQGDGGEDNYIVDLNTGERHWIKDRDRAIGHSDCWWPYVIGEADKPDPGGCGVRDLRDRSFRFLFPSLNMGYIAARGGRYLHTDDTGIYLLNFHTGERTLLHDHGVRVPVTDPTYYSERVKTNLDWSGTVGTFMAKGALYLIVL